MLEPPRRHKGNAHLQADRQAVTLQTVCLEVEQNVNKLSSATQIALKVYEFNSNSTEIVNS